MMIAQSLGQPKRHGSLRKGKVLMALMPNNKINVIMKRPIVDSAKVNGGKKIKRKKIFPDWGLNQGEMIRSLIPDHYTTKHYLNTSGYNYYTIYYYNYYN